jgi:hypothetical protein
MNQEKVALSETGRAFVTPIIGGIAAAGVAYGLPAAIEKIREVRVRNNRDKYIGEMQKVFPDLKEIDKKDLQVAYNSIAMHSPHVLRDPLLGGQTLKSMANYRQADVNALNEINKLRGNNMMDQALLNASNVVSSGVAEGFKGYQTQRGADQEQAYRVKIDTARADMDRAKFELETDKWTHKKTTDHDGTGYQKDRDAVADARETVRDAARDTQFSMTYQQKEDTAKEQIRQFQETLDQRDAALGTQVDQFQKTHDQRDASESERKRQYTQGRVDHQQESARRRKAERQARHDKRTDQNRSEQLMNMKIQQGYEKGVREQEKHDHWKKNPDASKRASAEYVYDIVARIRGRQL